MKMLTLALSLVLAVAAGFAQTTVFADDFSANQDAGWTTTGQIGSSAWSANRSGDDWGARRNLDPAQLELTNDASGTANVAGWMFASVPTSGFGGPYNATLALIDGLVTWYVNLRQIRPDPAGFGSGNYGLAFILAGSSTSAFNSGSGYALALGQTGSTDPLRLVKYSAGIGSFTNLITSNTSGLTDFGNEYLSVKVTYDPSTNTWVMFLRNDGTSAFSDPMSGTLVSQGTAVDNTYTLDALAFLGAYWQGSTSATQTAFFDNVTVQVTPNIAVYAYPSALSGFSYMQDLGPSAEQAFTVSGVDVVSDISISAPTHYEISASSGSGFGPTLTVSPTRGDIPPTTVYVRLKAGLGAGDYNSEDISVSSGGATTVYVTCSGSVLTGAVPATPVATAASAVDHSSFTANWNAVPYTSSYRLDVYTGSDVSDLFFSEYIEGTSYNKAIEIYNGTGAAVDLSNYKLHLYSNGAPTASNTLDLSGTLTNADVYVIAHPSASAGILAVADQTSSAVINFNGDDAVALYNVSTASLVDIFGRIGEDPGDFWGVSPNITKDQTMIRKASVSAGISQNPDSGFPTLTSEWDFYPVDTASDLGSHTYGSKAISYVPGYQDLNVGNVTSHLVTGLDESTDYRYQVRAVNLHGTSGNSNEIDVTTTSSTAPVIYASHTFSPFSTTEGTPSASQHYYLSSSNLTGSISMAIPAGFELSTDGGSSYLSSSTSVASSFSGNIHVRLAGTAGTWIGNIVHSSPGAIDVSLYVSGLVTSESVTTPTIQASGITGYPAFTSITAEWTPGNGTFRLVKVNTSNSFSNPTDGSTYTANTYYLGSGEQVVYNGATEYIEGEPYNGVTVTNLTPDTAYWFRVYEYNGSGIDTKYLTTTAANNPRSVSTTTSSGSGYYADIYGYGITIKGLLHSLLRTTHTTEYSYTATTTQLKYTDQDPNNSNNVLEIYTGWSIDADSYGGDATDWNKEHTWSKSHGDFGDTAPAGTDLHHLRPCDATVNSSKSNKDFDDGGTAVTDSSPPPGYTGATGCYQTYNTWEPRPDDKGDVARIIMYMAVRYEGTDTSYDLELVDHVYSDASENLPYYGKLATLLQWHATDPPDAWEVRRNNRIAERQGNRNPFIDLPGYAARIWAPCPLFNSDITTTGFTANWSVPITATNYYLQVATDSLFTNVVSGYSNFDVDLLTSKVITGLSAGGTYYYRLRSYFEDDYGMWSPYLQVVLDNPVTATATITPTQTLEEVNLNGATVTYTLSDASFSDSSLSASNFTLNNAPAGLSIQSVSHVNSTTALITLAFTGTDFDSNYADFSITVATAELSVDYPVTSNTDVIHAHVEGTATIALEGADIKLTLTPVPGAVSYVVYGSSDPYGSYELISDTTGSFDPMEPNVWRVTANYFTENRLFFKVSAVL
ncbi:MAG: endonuclease [Candidatus Cloacimonetes bacterium]|nr:endonuclease [Candidatus Cloacimonadota bacterium]MDY0366545.1 endonuclease [Candidatus Syntrophosphaera sp.]